MRRLRVVFIGYIADSSYENDSLAGSVLELFVRFLFLVPKKIKMAMGVSCKWLVFS